MSEQREKALNRIALAFALFTLVALLLGCVGSYVGTLLFTENSAWLGAIIVVIPHVVTSFLLLLFVRPHYANVDQKVHLQNARTWSLLLTLVSVVLVIWLSTNVNRQIEIDTRQTLTWALATWSLGYFGGLTIMLLGSQRSSLGSSVK